MAEELKDIQKENKELTEEQENEVSEEINDEVEEPTDEVEEPTNEVEEELTDEEKEELEKAKKEQKRENIINCLIVFGFPGLLVLAFLLTGLLVSGAWRYNWLLFLAIPIYWSGLVAFYKKNPNFFLFPLLAVAIYIFIGLAVKDNKGWHPYWLILLEIPVYYVACWLVKTLLKEEEPKEEVEPEPEPETQPEPEPETQPEPEVAPVVNPEPVAKPKKQISHRREKLASKPKEKKVKVVTEDKNYNKKKNKVKIKADISHNPDYKENANEELNNEE